MKVLQSLLFKDNRCHYCRTLLFSTTATKDHKVPKCKGGKKKDNIVLACSRCNNLKGNMKYEIFMAIVQIGVERAINNH